MKLVKMLTRIGILTLALACTAGCGGDKPAGGEPKISGDNKFNDLKPAQRSGGGTGGAAPKAGGAGGGGAAATGPVTKD